MSDDDREHTHHCDDCDLDLAILYDDREQDVPLVCGHCSGTNTRKLEVDSA